MIIIIIIITSGGEVPRVALNVYKTNMQLTSVLSPVEFVSTSTLSAERPVLAGRIFPSLCVGNFSPVTAMNKGRPFKLSWSVQVAKFHPVTETFVAFTYEHNNVFQRKERWMSKLNSYELVLKVLFAVCAFRCHRFVRCHTRSRCSKRRSPDLYPDSCRSWHWRHYSRQRWPISRRLCILSRSNRLCPVFGDGGIMLVTFRANSEASQRTQRLQRRK